MKLGRKRSRRANRDVGGSGLRTRALHRTDDLAIIGQFTRGEFAALRDLVHGGAPGVGLLLGALGPFASACQRGSDLLSASSPNERRLARNAAGLARIKGIYIERDEPAWGTTSSTRSKSCRRVPTARIKSASLVRALAAVDPVTPTEPSCSGWSHGSELLPACVSQTGTPCRSENSRSAPQAPP